jgi:hypothetical protein
MPHKIDTHFLIFTGKNKNFPTKVILGQSVILEGFRLQNGWEAMCGK